MSTTLSFQSIANSSLPVAEKSAMMRAYERVSGLKIPDAIASKYHMAVGAGAEGLHVVRAYGESGIGGAVLGAVSGKFGLDHKVEGQNVPMDLVGAGVLAVAAMGLGAMGNPTAVEARNLGAACTTVFMFRKTEAFVKKGAGVHGDVDDDDDSTMGEDPIVRAARAL